MKRSRATLYLYVVLSAALILIHPVEGNRCKEIVRYITQSMGIQSRIRPNIVGEWTSSRCEVRPGPKYLTRHIQIHRNASWEGRFHYYTGYSCNKPLLTVLIKGYYTMGREGYLKGSTLTNFNFTFIELHPHTVAEEKSILKVARKSCPNTLRNISSDGGIGVYVVDQHAFNRRSCRNRFLISKYELQMIKLDELKGKGSQHDTLYFAEIPFGKKIRRKQALNSYQTPLKRYNAPNCTVCSKVRRSTVTRPYSFAKKQPLPVLLDNEWGSFTCETIHNTFLTRYMTFNSKNQTFEGYFHYFNDPNCKKLDFVLYAKGHFTGGIRSTKVKNAENYVFNVTEASITPHRKKITRRINSMSRDNLCGKDNEWRTGVPQSITKSNGCKVYGISLPHTEYDLLKMGVNEDNVRELYVGQRPSDNTSPTSPSTRPTSYQIPFIECSSLTKVHFVPPTPEPTTKLSTRYPSTTTTEYKDSNGVEGSVDYDNNCTRNNNDDDNDVENSGNDDGSGSGRGRCG